MNMRPIVRPAASFGTGGPESFLLGSPGSSRPKELKVNGFSCVVLGSSGMAYASDGVYLLKV